MKKSVFSFVVSAVAVGFVFSSAAQAQKWADLTLTVILDGDIPKQKNVDVKADAFCMENPIKAEDLIVDPATKGVANFAFMIDVKKTKLTPAQIHPDLQKASETKPVLDNVKCVFVPHVMTMRAGQTLLVKNSDKTAHNAKFSFFKNDEVNPLIPAGGEKDVVTKIEEPGATKVECNIHPWMSSYVFVTNHPYIGISDAQGKIKIEKLPAGVELDFKLWHEKTVEEVTLSGKNEKWAKGSVKLTLKEGANDIGIVKMNPEKFKTK